MKKLFLIIPVGLIAVSGFILFSSQKGTEPSAVTTAEVSLSSKNPEQLFTLSQESLRLIVRHGESESIGTLKESVSELESQLSKYEEHKLSIGSVRKMIAQYKADSTSLSQTAQPFLEKIKQHDRFEEKEEEKFIVAIKQIGLYDLETTYKKLSKARVDYLKEPSAELEEQYRATAGALTQTIKELYLDSAIEDPLYAYINNHKGYFETVAACYNKTGFQRVNRLRQNSYAIKTELQLLPTI